MSCPIITHKRGTSIDWEAKYEINGQAVDLSAVTVTCQFRRKLNHELVANIDCVKSNQSLSPGVYRLQKSAVDVAAFPVGELIADIKYSSAGNVDATETFSIIIEQSVTE